MGGAADTSAVSDNMQAQSSSQEIAAAPEAANTSASRPLNQRMAIATLP
jgi:hypothetical protein